MSIAVVQEFLLDPCKEKKLLEEATFLGQTNLTDMYFDNSAYFLTKSDCWLRRRDNSWNLKLPQNKLRKPNTHNYLQLQTEEEICRVLGITPRTKLEIELENEGILPFAKIRTFRQFHTKDSFEVDIKTSYLTPDEPDKNIYQVTEIALTVGNEEAVAEAHEEIMRFAVRHGLTKTFVRRKIIECIFRFRPHHYNALIKAGIIFGEQTT